jgi:hypothetical protein
MELKQELFPAKPKRHDPNLYFCHIFILFNPDRNIISYCRCYHLGNVHIHWRIEAQI